MTQLKDIVYTGDHLHRSSRFALVRSKARTKMKYYKRICQACGYDKHVEVAHIKPLNQFKLEDTDTDFNSEDNLLLLCPNCHWEFDNLPNFSLTALNSRELDTEKIQSNKAEIKQRRLATRINSAELHRMVWDRPATKVALDLGISSSAVKRLCKRRGIDTPFAGFWRKVQTGNITGLSCPLPLKLW